MVVPFVLVFIAVLTAAAMAYGMDPQLAQLDKGLELIMLTRRLQWPLVTVSLLSCLSLLVLVIAGKRRAWWLIALAPVVALFLFRFGSTQAIPQYILDNPPFVDASAASFVLDDDWVVGVSFAGEELAFPYGALWTSPVVLHAVHDRRLMLMWSPYANCATAYAVSREIRPRELEILGMPANGLLVYDRRLGQFISGITGHSPRGSKPVGFLSPVAARKMTWSQWRRQYPQTRVLAVGSAARDAAPSAPLLPKYPMPAYEGIDPQTRIALVLSDDPIAVVSETITSEPLNITAGSTPVLLFRDESGLVRALDRRLEEDLIPRFALNRDRRRSNVRFVDSDTGAGWSAAGVAIDGEKELRGHKLKSIEVEDNLYWGVMKYWYPALRLHREAGDESPDASATTASR